MSQNELTPDEFVETLSDKMLQCREMGHTWRVTSTWHRVHSLLGFRRVLTCTTCKTKRTDIVGTRGVRLGTKYDHAEGYLYRGGKGRVSRDVARLVSLERSGVLEDEVN